jgi:hypothetical protein
MVTVDKKDATWGYGKHAYPGALHGGRSNEVDDGSLLYYPMR